MNIEAKPALRDEVLLNGTWDEGGPVPVYGGATLSEQVYRRQVTVPPLWTDKVIKVEFEAVNYQAELYVDDQLVASHVGAWNPFAVDVTEHVQPGKSFALKVVVKGMLHPPTVDADGHEQWPVGAYSLNNAYGGIADDVWLRAYGRVHIEDAFIQPSFREKTLTVDYTLRNTTDEPQTVQVMTSALRSGSVATEQSFTGPKETLLPGETKTTRTVFPWTNPTLWWPDRPTLYHLTSRLAQERKVLDTETRRFGFREIWIEKNQFRLNGVRLNLRGDYAGFHGYWPPEYQTPENLPRTYDLLKGLNFNAFRWHQRPAPRFALDLADEKGLILVCESALYGHATGLPIEKKPTYVANCHRWIPAWARGSRNHASVLLWSVVNEMGPKYNKNQHQQLTVDELRALGDTLRACDTTRPILYHGNGDVDDETVNYHYPLPSGWDTVTESIYSWASLVHPDKPTGIGEFFQTSKTAKHPSLTQAERDVFTERNKWWLGTWTRGMRYVNVADFRPKIFFWAHQEMDSARVANVRNAFAPVALFDKEYDDLGIAPFVDHEYPVVAAGTTLQRTLVLYNDEFQGTNVTMDVQIRSGATVHARGAKTVNLPLGEHIDVPYSFQVPFRGGQELEVVLQTFKGGAKRFEEAKRFRVSGPELPDKTADVVRFGAA